MKSDFESIVPEDFAQFKDIAKRFKNVKLEDADELYQLTIDSWLLATRWSEIQSTARKISNDYGISKTEFNDWCYAKYRQLQEMHVTVRSWFRISKEDEKANNIIGG